MDVTCNLQYVKCIVQLVFHTEEVCGYFSKSPWRHSYALPTLPFLLLLHVTA